MLGRQFNLVVTEHDLDLIEGVLRSRGDVQFLSSSTNEGRNALLPLKSLRVDRPVPGSGFAISSLLIGSPAWTSNRSAMSKSTLM